MKVYLILALVLNLTIAVSSKNITSEKECDPSVDPKCTEKEPDIDEDEDNSEDPLPERDKCNYREDKNYMCGNQCAYGATACKCDEDDVDISSEYCCVPKSAKCISSDDRTSSKQKLKNAFSLINHLFPIKILRFIVTLDAY